MIDDGATVRRAGTSDGPLLLVLHGYGANETDLVPLLGYLGHRSDAAFLRAPIPLGPGSWAWFPLTVSVASPDLGARQEEVEAAARDVLDWLDENASGHDVVLLGFSQGGAVALQLMRTDPGRVRAVVALSSFVVGAGNPTPAAGDNLLAEARPPVFFGHGGADVVIPPVLTQATSAWLAAHTTLTERSYPSLPHAVDGQELADVRHFLTTYTKE